MSSQLFALGRRRGVLAGAFALSCSFYTDCPCANKPAPTPSGSGGVGGSAGTAGMATGGSGLGDFNPGGGDDGVAGESGGGNEPPPLQWLRATGNLSGRSAACGNVNFMNAKGDEDLILLSIAQSGLWGSRDGGANWNPLGTGKRSALIQNGTTAIVYDPDESERFWEVGIYGPGVYRTEDDGTTFTNLGSVSHNDYLTIDFSDPDRQLMMVGGHEQAAMLFRSQDGGENWEQIGDALPESCQQSSYPRIIAPDNILLGCRNSILRTTDQGGSWEELNAYGGMMAPLVTTQGVIYWTIDGAGGVVRSADDGDNWERVVGGGLISNLPLIELPDGSIAAINGKTVVRSEDEGLSWDSVSPELPFAPNGFTYSPAQGAFYAWQSTCDDKIPKDAVVRLSIEF